MLLTETNLECENCVNVEPTRDQNFFNYLNSTYINPSFI